MRKQPAAVQPFLMLQAERERRGLIKCLFGYRQRNLEKIIVNCALRSDLKGKGGYRVILRFTRLKENLLIHYIFRVLK